MVEPILSIVIANYNYGRFLEEAIQSVIAQDMGDKIELIICDAASTDNSVEIIKKYANGLPPNTSYGEWIARTNSQPTTHNSQLITWWCSEKDGGQSAAFNKGFSHARGRFLTWLNADDVLFPGALKAFLSAVEKYPDCEWFVGGVMWLDKNMRIVRCGKARAFSRVRADAGSIGVWGPSSIFSRRLYDCAGGIDERFIYTMDTDLWLRLYYIGGATYRPFTDYAWGLRLHECAKMSAHDFAETGQSNPNHPKWKQIANEREWRLSKCRYRQRMTWIRFVLSVNYFRAISSRIDAFLFKGRHYKEFFK